MKRGEIRIIKDQLKTGDIILEIGTGLGFVSSFCAKRIGSENVFTFEANPVNIEIARRVFIKNSVNPVLENAILSEDEGVVEFSVDKKNILASSLLVSKNDSIKVEKISLNDVIAAIKPNFLVMDIEGAEYEIFKQISLQSIIKIQFELHPYIIGEEKCTEIFKLLNCNGFLKDERLSVNSNYYFFKQ